MPRIVIDFTDIALIHHNFLMCLLYTVRSCPALSAPQNGLLNCSVGVSSSQLKCVVRCQKGYRLEGEARLTCLPNLQWSSPPPRCVGKLTRVCVCVCVCGHICASGNLTFTFIAFGRHSGEFKAQSSSIINLVNKPSY